MKWTHILSLALLFSFTTAIDAQHSDHIDHNHPGHEYDVRFVNQSWDPHPPTQTALRQNPEWQNFLKKHGDWWVEFNETTQLPRRAFGKPISFPKGADLETTARQFLSTELSQFNLPLDELGNALVKETPKSDYVRFKQVHKGLEVLYCHSEVRFNKDGSVKMFAAEMHPNVSIETNPSLSITELKVLASRDFGSVSHIEVQSHFILPVPGLREEGGYEYKLVLALRVDVDETGQIPGKYFTLIDAHTGKIWYRQNEVHTCGFEAKPMAGSLEVSATITENPTKPTVSRRLPHAEVLVGGTTYYTDDNGEVTIASITGPTTARVFMRGRYAEVFIDAGGLVSSSFTTTVTTGTNTITVPSSIRASEVSAYYGVNQIHDSMKVWYPGGYTGLDYPFTTRVDRTDGSCNAFYDGSSVNFYAAGGGCPATAFFNDVVFHEYGHGLNYELYDLEGHSFTNGALGEGYSDLWGMSVTKDPVLGLGFSGGTTTFVRRYDIDPKVYPVDLVGQVHADGEIIAGAWWDYGQELGGHVDSMRILWLQNFDDGADEPSGEEGKLYRDILLYALMDDDNDGDLSTGTPHDEEIIQAFADHGITLLANADINHEELLGLPPSVGLDIDAEIDVDFPAFLGDISMYWRLDAADPWTKVAMTNTTGKFYRGSIPAQPEGTIFEYYFEVEDDYGNVAAVDPFLANASPANLPYYGMVGFTILHEEDFDNTFGGWVTDPFANDDATTGKWDFENPRGTSSGSYEVQMEKDKTTKGFDSDFCAFTGQGSTGGAIGEQDVDDGKTTMQSEVFDLTDYVNPAFTYYRWYTNSPPTGANPGADYWQVYISDDGGSTLVPVENTRVSDNRWRRKAILVKDYVSLTDQVSFFFIASDSFRSGLPLDGGSLIEAGVDDLFLWEQGEVSGMDENQGLEAFNVFPNPASDQLHFTFSNPANASAKVKMFNAVGQKVFEMDMRGESFTIDVSELSAGSYVLEVESENGKSREFVTIGGR